MAMSPETTAPIQGSTPRLESRFDMAVKTSGLGPLRPYMDHAGDPAMPFLSWMQYFNTYIGAVNSNLTREAQLSDAGKKNLLLLNLGAAGFVRFSSHPLAMNNADADYTTFCQAVRDTFVVPVNRCRAIFDFRQRKQAQGETVAEFLTSLRSLAVDCRYGDTVQLNRELAIQLVLGCANKDTQEKLLQAPDFNFTEILNIMQAEETARASASVIQGENNVIATLKSKQNAELQRRRSKQNRSSNSSSSTFKPTANTQPCSGCGSKSHPSRDAACPALSAECRYCHRTGHFERVCNTKARDEQRAKRTNSKGNSGKAQKQLTMHTLSQDKEKFQCTLTLLSGNHRHDFTAEVDTGADTTTITVSEFNHRFSSTPLKKARHTLYGYDHQPVKGVLGYFHPRINFHDRTCEADIYVVPDSCSAVIGKNVIRPLAMVLHSDTLSVKTLSLPNFSTVLRDFPDLCSPMPGEYPDYEHVISLTAEAKPTVCKLRPIPLARRDAANDEIQAMMDADIWEPIERSPWVHGLVTVNKPATPSHPHGSVRITTDLRPLNKYVQPFVHPAPVANDIFLSLHGAKLFTKLDLSKGYFHVKLAEESRPLTATITPLGLMVYKRMPMGLKDSGAVFQYCITKTLQGLPGVIPYIDDILVYGTTQAEHDENLRRVLAALNAKNFRLNADKCSYSVSSVCYLGHVISADGSIKPDPRNVSAIADAPQPTTVKQVQRFLGMVYYYSDLIPDLTSIAEPLRKFTRKNSKFAWTDTCGLAFATLKAMVVDHAAVYIFNANAPTLVTTDASDVGVGATPSQVQGGTEVPIAYLSKTLTSAQRNYSTSEREGLACVLAVEHWEKFLIGRHSTLRTDHQSLQLLLERPGSQRQSSKFLRWHDRLSVFDFTVEYRKGSQNQVADYLSRLDHRAQALGVSSDDDQPTLALQHLHLWGISLDKIRSAMVEDTQLCTILRYMRTAWPSRDELSTELRHYYNVRDELELDDGFLTRLEGRTVVPSSLRSSLLHDAHTGHPGIVRMKRKLRECYWWPGLDKQVEDLCKTCRNCQESAKSAPPLSIAQSPFPAAKSAAERFAIDIAGPFDTAPTHQRFLVVLLDHFSGFPEVLATNDITSDSVIKWLETQFARYGNPDSLLSDNGPQFVSHTFGEFLLDRDIEHLRSAVYNPQSNGKLERFNRHLKLSLQTYVHSRSTWIQAIDQILAHYRATSPTPAGKSPAELFLGRRIRLPFECVKRSRPLRPRPTALDTSSALVTPRSSASSSHLRCRGPFKNGDQVMYKKPHVRKGHSPYSAPLAVQAVLGHYTYRLSDGSVWNARRLRRFRPSMPLPAADTPVVDTPSAPADSIASRLSRPARGVIDRYASVDFRT